MKLNPILQFYPGKSQAVGIPPDLTNSQSSSTFTIAQRIVLSQNISAIEAGLALLVHMKIAPILDCRVIGLKAAHQTQNIERQVLAPSHDSCNFLHRKNLLFPVKHNNTVCSLRKKDPKL